MEPGAKFSPSATMTADDVTKKISEFLKPDGKLSREELKKIDLWYSRVQSKKGKQEVRGFVNANVTGESKKNLQNLLETVDVIKGDFNMKILADNSNSEFFNMILGKEKYLIGYKAYIIGPLLKKHKEFFPNGHDTIDVIYWKKITEEIGMKSVGSMAKDKVMGFFEGIAGKLSGAGKKAGEQGVDLEDMGNIVGELAKIGDDAEREQEAMGLIKKLKGYIYHMTKDYTKNLDLLIELGKTDKVGLTKLLNNPVALDEVLESGKYKKDGYTIDLDKKEVKFNKNPDLKKSQDAFMKVAIKATNGNGSKLDALKHKTKDIIGAFKKFGLEASDLRDFKESLKSIPIIGQFLYMLLNFFLGDKLLDILEGKYWSEKYKTSGENFQAYIKKNAEELPFVMNNDDFEDEETTGSIESFISKVNRANKSDYENTNSNKKLIDSKFKPEPLSLLSNKGDFWKEVFGKNEPTNPITKQLWAKANELKAKYPGEKIAAKDFFKQLKDLEIKITKKEVALTAEQKEAKAVIEQSKKSFTIEDEALLLKELEKLDKFPSKITIKTKGGIEKTLDIDFKESKILINNKEFVFKTGDLMGIKFESENVLLTIKDSAGNNTETTVPKKDFLGILAKMAIGEKITSGIMDIVSIEDKKRYLDQTDIVNKQVKQTENFKGLTDEENKLKVGLEQINTEISGIKEELEKVGGLNEQVTILEGTLAKIDKEIKVKEEKKQKNIESIAKWNIGLDEIGKKLEDSWLPNIIGSKKELIEKKLLVRKIRETKRENDVIDSDIASLNIKATKARTALDALKLKVLKKEEKKIELEANKEKIDKRILEIKTELGASKKEIEDYKKKLEIQKKAEEQAQLEAQKKAEEAKRKLKEAETVLAAGPGFQKMLESPTKIEKTKLTLSDGTQIVFNKSDLTISFLGEKFGAKKLKEEQKFLLGMLTFERIYKQIDFKSNFIKTLSELKKQKKSNFKGIEFIKVS